jgi:hypothetical protein
MAEPARTAGTPIPQPGDPRFRWFCPKPTVRILFYTDDVSVNLDPDVEALENEFGVAVLCDLLVGDDSDVADFQISLVNRHAAGHASHKLTAARLAEFDQVWFFGIRLANTSTQPDNELTDPEVAALDDWMATGGVLVTGDHANPRPSGADPNLDPLLGLGRAIAHRVPRAGELRRWEGNPAQFDDESEETYSYNTQVPTGRADVDDLALQEDEWPQTLILKTYPVPGGGPFDPTQSLERRVHRLFCGRTTPIKVFPDHMHEGHLVIPSAFPQDTWPSGPSGQPLPEVIARGTDKRTGALYDIVTAYDGSSAAVGRIVADSTWHHYFNVNLKGFPAGRHVRPQLAQFYVNLAVWLSPPARRFQIACWQRWKLVHTPTVVMAYGNPLFVLGRAAASVLRRSGGPCTIRDVFEPVLAAPRPTQAVQPPAELMLGGVLHAYFEAFERADTGEDVGREGDINALVARGIRAAHDDYLARANSAVAQARQSREALEEQLRRDGYVTDG